MTNDEKNSRELLCEAAMRVAARDGLLALTLDRVAAESGFSKGGVMHHFRNKDELLLAVVGYFAGLVESKIVQSVADDLNPRQRWVHAMLELLFPDPSTDKSAELPFPSTNRLTMSILVLTLHNPKLMEPVKKLGFSLKQRLLSNPDDGIEQVIHWMVLDGLFLWELVGLVEAHDELHQKVIQALKTRVRAARNEVAAEGSKDSKRKSASSLAKHAPAKPTTTKKKASPSKRSAEVPKSNRKRSTKKRT